MIQDVHDAVADLVELIKTYKSKNKLSQVLMSTLFKQRQEEANAVIDSAISRLQVNWGATSSNRTVGNCALWHGTTAAVEIAVGGPSIGADLRSN